MCVHVCTCNCVHYMYVYNYAYFVCMCVCVYRTDEEEKADIKKYSKIAQDLNKKRRVLVSMHQEEEDEDEQTFKKDSKQQKRSHKEKVLEKKGILRKGRGVGRRKGGLSDSRLSSYGLSVQKIKDKRRRKVK